MNKIIVLFLIFISHFSHSQEIETEKLLPPESKQSSDLHFLKEELKGKRMVMLGEMTHMYGNIFEMKARVVEYLHQVLGYTTIAMESSMYDMWLMNAQNSEFNPNAFNNTVFGVWSGTYEFQRLVDYISENDIKVVGFDSQIINNIPHFIDSFFEFCQKQNIKIKLNRDDLGIAMEDVLEEIEYNADDINFKDYEEELERIIKAMQQLEATSLNYHWLQFTKSLLASSRDAFYKEKIEYKSDRADKNHNFRDKQMADNLLSYLERNPDEKLVVWADNIHIINDISSVNDPILGKFHSMGSWVKVALGKDVYSLATIHANDSLFSEKTWHHTPILEKSFEDQLVSMDKPYLFVKAKQRALSKPMKNRLLNYIHFSEARLDQLHDGYLFLKSATLPKKRESVSDSKEIETASDNKEKGFGRGTRTSLKIKGHIGNSETKQPIPFVTLILKEQEIYRISDENGSFELNVPEDTPADAIVNISALGYESKDLSLDQLQDKINLKPSFEQLDAVVLTGHGTTPRTVLKKAIKSIEENYSMDAFNFTRYGHFVLNRNDETLQDIEVITTDYSEGARDEEPYYQRTEQVKWNQSSQKKKFEYAIGLTGFREDPVKFASILHKRRFKKFDLEFVSSIQPDEQNLYIIKFETDKTRFGYTNRWFPTSYSGYVYINKDDLAIIKVKENWEYYFEEKDKEEVKYWLGEYKDELRGKVEYISEYTKQDDDLYFPSEYFIRRYTEKTNMKGNFVNDVFEGHSYQSNFTNKDLQVLTWEDRLKNSLLERVDYDESFWESFKAVTKNLN